MKIGLLVPENGKTKAAAAAKINPKLVVLREPFLHQIRTPLVFSPLDSHPDHWVAQTKHGKTKKNGS